MLKFIVFKIICFHKILSILKWPKYEYSDVRSANDTSFFVLVSSLDNYV